MQRWIRASAIAVLAGGVAACVTPPPAPPAPLEPVNADRPVVRLPPRAPDDPAVLDEEAEACFRFFWEQATTSPGSAYGLIRDRYPGNPAISSIASVGFGLSALPIGVERGWVTAAQARERASGTLDTFLALDNVHGFFFHFLDMTSGKRVWSSEVSIIDTGLFIAGALTAGAYFGGDVERKARALYERIEWPWYLDPTRAMFAMAYRPESGFAGHWDFYAEQLLLYVLAAGTSTHATDDGPYNSFGRHAASWNDTEPFIHSWFGSLFTHQFSHAWVDFRGRADRAGVDWWANSVAAARAQRAYAAANPRSLKTLGPESWGLSASDGPSGYGGRYGAPPSGLDNRQHVIDGTVPPYAATASIVFTPVESLAAMNHYRSYRDLWGRYGLVDAYNTDVEPPWFDPDVIGIDKGISLLMLENHRSGLIWRLFMSVDAVERGLGVLGIGVGE